MDFIDIIDSYGEDSLKIAQIYDESVLTYKELKKNSDALAVYIIDNYGNDKTPIIIYGHKQHEMLLCFLACSKAGHAYIPIDITFPPQRIAEIIESSGAKLFFNISGLQYTDKFIRNVQKDEINEIIKLNMDKSPSREFKLKDNDVYYILYTSGSTGKPKGVQITKSCIDSFINWFKSSCMLQNVNGLFMNQVSYSFDVSVITVYIGLIMGRTLYVIDKDMIADYKKLFYNFNKSGIALWISTPSFVEMCMLDQSFNKELIPYLEKVILAGEILTNKLVDGLFQRFGDISIINGYGPTEATVLITAVEITKEMNKILNPLPIGYAMEGSKIIFVDEKGVEVPEGEKGELLVIGDSVSTGYYNNEEMTEKVFFSGDINGSRKRGYKTGDLAYIKDGLIYYSGRKDFQIKLNGFRIELEDIENNLRRIDIVSNAVVLPVYKDEKISHLTAFITLSEKIEEKEFKIGQRIKNELAKLVPSYMVPRQIKFKESFETNTNGKINRKLLMEELR